MTQEKKDIPTIKEERTTMAKLKRMWPILAVFGVLLIISIALLVFSGGCSSPKPSTNNSTSSLMTALQDKNTIQDSRLIVLESKENRDWTSEIKSLNNKVATLESTVIAPVVNYSGQITSLQAQITALTNVIANMSGAPTIASQLSITVLGSMPVIVADGNYSFTVRISNSGTTTATGNIVMQLTAKSGMTTVYTALVSSGSVTWKEAQIKPTASSSSSITVVSDQIYLIGGSSAIYQFTLSLTQNGAFEWTPILTVTQ